MTLGSRLRGTGHRIASLGRLGILVTVLGLAVLAPVSFMTIEHTSQPEFCNTCHIMEPYYDSWLSSGHGDVNCIDCHYEPGAVETVRGKFQALSQLAKYVTRTQGTKPWAEVSDQSCMRSGCHSVRLLEGEIGFNNIKFDHRHHLLETRRGRRLRCTSCHSQIVQGEHLTVTPTVCFTCHFMPGFDEDVVERIGDCETCHGPPEEVVDVAGRPFDHQEYLQRGVDCRDCHNPVVQGDGAVRRERCHSCHGEIGHIERYDETEFLHAKHVTDHKVECFECHDDIQHGLLPLDMPEHSGSTGCGTCHADSHNASRMLYAGTGAVGVPDRPSRMYETRVVCAGCHTGRSTPPTTSPHAALMSANGGVAEAGSVDCMHCHGTGIKGMLGDWQSAVGEQLSRLDPLLERVDAAAPSDPDDPARVLLEEARWNLLLIQLDGSRGAHNVPYALDCLRAAGERLDRAQALLDPAVALDAASGMPFVSQQGCSDCHLGIEYRRDVMADARPFQHAPHFTAGLDCQSCHSLTEPGQPNHGHPSPGRGNCNSCHHQEDSDLFDVWDCASCHAAQGALLTGTVHGFEPTSESAKAEMECTECHGDPPDMIRPPAGLCVLCHEDGYDGIMERWQETIGPLTSRVAALRDRLHAPVRDADPALRAAYDEAARALAAVEADGSLGVHNVNLTLDLLAAAAEGLDGVERGLGTGTESSIPESLPLRTEHGCTTCHVGFESGTTLADGPPFPHRRHIETAGLDCAQCHDLDEHAELVIEPEDCASCHHGSESALEKDCTDCHQLQGELLYGEVPGFEPLPSAKSDLDCGTCHGELPDVASPAPSLCGLCHDEVDEELEAWRSTFTGLRDHLGEVLGTRADVDAPAVRAGHEVLRVIDGDRSAGVHNAPLTRRLLEDALRELNDGR